MARIKHDNERLKPTKKKRSGYPNYEYREYVIINKSYEKWFVYLGRYLMAAPFKTLEDTLSMIDEEVDGPYATEELYWSEIAECTKINKQKLIGLWNREVDLHPDMPGSTIETRIWDYIRNYSVADLMFDKLGKADGITTVSKFLGIDYKAAADLCCNCPEDYIRKETIRLLNKFLRDGSPSDWCDLNKKGVY